jgi:nicotinamide-nucleotide amidase
MTASIITIGDEILIGQITDTNSGFIANALDRIGIRTVEMRSIGDDRSEILDTFSAFQDKVDLVVITGGLGPTKDDITKTTFCDYFEDELIADQHTLAHIADLFETVYKVPVSAVNRDQALVPSKAAVLRNRYGSAPGMWMKSGKTVFVSLPGVPFEMKAIVENELVPKLIAEFDRPHIVHKTILTYGQGESRIAERIEDWENGLPDFIRLAYLPAAGRVRLRLTARGNDKDVLEKAVAEKVEALRGLIADIIVGFDDGQTIEAAIGGMMRERKLTLAVAESCTGGKIAQMLTSVAGASRFFSGGIVAYNEPVKTKILGVQEQTIAKHSVVSEQVAVEMAERVRALFNSDYGIGVTGNAGPTTDKTDKSVGVVFIAIATPGKTWAEEFNFGQPREKVIDRAASQSLDMLRKEILAKPR